MVIPASTIRMGRRWAESLMTDSVRVFSRVESGDFDPVTGEPSFTDTDVYVGPCRLVLRSGVVRDVDAAAQLVGLQSPRLDLPVVGSEGVEGGHHFVVTASGTDSALVGVSGVVQAGFPQTHATARRLPVEVVG